MNNFWPSIFWKPFLCLKQLFDGKLLLKGSDCVFNAGWVCHVWWNILPGFICRTTIIFGTPKNNSLKINSLPLTTCFSNRNVFKMASKLLSKMVLKKSIFCQKCQNFVHFGRYNFGSNFASMWSKYVSNNVLRL